MNMDRWVDKNQVSIPPLRKKGFSAPVQIRDRKKLTLPAKPVQPVQPKPVQPEPVQSQVKPLDLVIPVIPTAEDESSDSNGEEATVFMAMQEAKARVVREKTGEAFSFTKQCVIGKSSVGTDFRIADNTKISRRHVRIFRENDKFYMEDLQSSNGTWINQQRITEICRLNDQQEFSLADETFTIHISR